MNTAYRVIGFLAALAVVFGVALGVGNALGPVTGPVTSHEAGGHAPAREGGAPERESNFPGGLMVSHAGYSFQLADQAAEQGPGVPVSFTIEGPDGRPVTDYEREHEKRLHLIAVRRDFSGFQHVHPELDSDGLWSTRLDLAPGPWRLFADFTAAGAGPLTLGADLQVGGEYLPESGASEVRTASVDGYSVSLSGDLRPGSDAKLTLRVARDGRPVTDLQPYLGAYGHLVALREGDLAYLHVHPDGSPGDGRTDAGPEVVFHATVPSGGDYRLFLDFKHGGQVRTAAFRVATGRSAGDSAAPDAGRAGAEEEQGHGHHH